MQKLSVDYLRKIETCKRFGALYVKMYSFNTVVFLLLNATKKYFRLK